MTADAQWAGRPVCFACSPRKGGNSDAATRIFADATGCDPHIVRLRETPLAPCIGCGGCEAKGRCILPDAPAAGDLFEALRQAPFVFFASPIYFYHLPAGFKAWIDRSQAAYLRWMAGDPAFTGLAKRPAYVCLAAGRPTGDQLFAGSVLTLSFFLKTFHLTIADKVLLRGVDAPGDLEARADAVTELRRMGDMAGKQCG